MSAGIPSSVPYRFSFLLRRTAHQSLKFPFPDQVPCLWLWFCVALVLMVLVPDALAQTAHSLGLTTVLSSGFGNPTGVAVDGSGNVFVADPGTNLVKEIPYNGGSYGTPVTVSGGFNSPSAVAVDGSGNLYVADYGAPPYYRLSKVFNSVDGYGSPVTLASGFSSSIGIAVDSSGDIYIADAGKNAVSEMPYSGGAYGTSVQLGQFTSTPLAVAVDSTGNLFVSLRSSGSGKSAVVQELRYSVGAYGTPETVAGVFVFPAGVAVDGSDNVYVADSALSTISKIPVAGGSYGPPLTLGAGFSSSSGVAVDSNGNVYVADSSNGTVKEISAAVNFGPVAVATRTPASQTITFSIDSTGSLGAPVILTEGAAGLDFSDAGIGTCTTNGSTHIYNAGDTCTLQVNFTPAVPGLRRGVVQMFSSSGSKLATVYISGTGTGPQAVFNPGTFSRLDYGLTESGHTAVDGLGNLYVASWNYGPINVIPAGCSSPDCVGGLYALSPFTYSGPTLDGAGNVYVTNPDGLVELPVGCQSSSCVVTLASGYLKDVAVDGNGNVYTESITGVEEIPSGCTSQSCLHGLGGGFGSLVALAISGNGIVYVADEGSGIKQIPAGCISATCVITVYSSGDYISGLVVDATGSLYFIDVSNGTLQMMQPGCMQNICSILISSDIPADGLSFFLAADSKGNLYGTGPASSLLYKMDRVDPPSLTFTPAAPGLTSSSSPQLVTLANIGNMPLTFPLSATGRNGIPSANFSLSNSSTCPQVTPLSGVATLAAGSTCNAAIGFTPLTATNVPVTGSLLYTDNNLNASGSIQAISLNGPSVTQPVITSLSVPVAVATNQQSTAIVTISDPSNAVAGVSISFGDGSAPVAAALARSGATLTASASWQYQTPGSYTITVSSSNISLSGGNTATTTVTGAYAFSSAAIGQSPTSSTLTFTLPAGGQIAAPVVLTEGTPGLDFSDAGTGTCTTNGSTHVYNTGDTCTVQVNFTPTLPGLRRGAVELVSTSGANLATLFVSGTGQGPQAVFNGGIVSQVDGNSYSPGHMAVNGSGTLYVADEKYGGVTVIPAGCSSSSCTSELSVGVNQSSGLALDGAGNVYVSNTAGHLLELPAGCTSSGCGVTLGGGKSVSEIAVDGGGNVYAQSGASVLEILSGCISQSCVQTLGGGFTAVQAIALSGNGTVYVVDRSANSSIIKQIPAGCLSSACVATVFSLKDFVSDLAVDVAGSVYFIDFSSGTIQMIEPGCTPDECFSGLQTFSAISSVIAAGEYPFLLAIDAKGNLYTSFAQASGTNTGPNPVYKVDRVDPPSLTFALTEPGAISSDSPQTVTLANIGNMPLTFPSPATGQNGSLSANFSLSSATNCPQIMPSSSVAILAAGSACNAAISFTPLVNMAGSVTGSLTYTDNNLAIPGSAQAIVLNGSAQLPVISMSIPPPVLQGQTVQATVKIYDPNSVVTSVTVNFGDGSAPMTAALARNGSNVVAYVSYSYSTAGTYTVTTNAVYGANSLNQNTTVHVLALPVITSQTVTSPFLVGQPGSATVVFSDPNSLVTSVALAFGDGTSTSASITRTGTTVTATASHTYTASASALNIVANVQLSTGNLETLNVTTATAAALSIVSLNAGPFVAGQAGTATAIISDPSSLVTTVQFGFNDGTVPVPATISRTGSTVTATATHTYALPNTYTVTVRTNGPSSAANASQSTSVQVTANQTISFGPLANATYGSPDFGLTATSNSGLAVSYSASGSCSITGSSAVHILGVGSCLITAAQAGNAVYGAATNITQPLTIVPLPVTITAGTYSGVYDGNTHIVPTCVSSYPGVNCTNSPAIVGPSVGSGAVNVTTTIASGVAADYSVTTKPGSWSITQVPVSTANSTLTVGSSPAVAGSTVIVTATLKDSNGNAINGTAVSFSSSSTTANFGTPSVTGNVITVSMTDTAVETAAISIVLGGSATGMLSGSAQFVPAAYVVTVTTDEATGNGVASNCVSPNISTSGNGNCSLRDAVAAADALTGVTANISFALPNSSTITIAQSAPIQITQNATISGPGANQLAISGGGQYSIFNMSGQVTLSGITLENATKASGNGGAIYSSAGSLTLINCSVTNNSAPSGGAIYSNSSGLLTITGSSFYGNTATDVSGGVNLNGTGGAVSASSAVIVSNSTFSGNSGGNGGAVYSNSNVKVSSSTFAGNSTPNRGDAAAIFAGGSITAVDSIFAGNLSYYVGALDPNGSSTIDHSLFYGNRGLAESDCSGSCFLTNEITADPKLSALGSYGGSTPTLLPLPGSATICSGTQPVLNSTPLAADQRGVAISGTRYGQTACYDIGAVQTNYSLGTSFTTQPPSVVSPGLAISPAVVVTENGLGFGGASVALAASTGTLSVTSATSAAQTGLANFSGLTISGAQAGDYLTASFALGTVSGSNPASSITLTVNSSTFSSLTLAAPATLTGQAGVAYSQSLATANGSGSYSYAVTSSAQLPGGLSLNAATGQISGTPSAVGSFPVTVTVTDTASSATASATFTLVTSAPQLSIGFTQFPYLTVGVPVSFSFFGAGGTAPYTFIGNLPPGLTISSAGVVSGTPTTAISTFLVITMTDSTTGSGAPYTRSANYGRTIAQGAATVTLVPASLTQTYNGSSLAASATVSPSTLPVSELTFTYTGTGSTSYGPSTTAPTNAGTYAVAATLNDANYTGSTSATAFTVTKVPASVTPNAASKVYGTVDAALTGTLSGFLPADGITATYARTAGETVAGSPYAISATLAPAAALANYAVTLNTAAFTITKAGPVTAWTAPAAITYGTSLTAAQLNATANVPGSFSYSPSTGMTPSAGKQTLTAVFTPTDSSDYSGATVNVTLTVNQATPLINWATPAAISYGTPLGAAQLNATANVLGSFAYSPAAGTVLAVGKQTLKATFTPADTNDYTGASSSVALTVNTAVPTITLTVPNHIYGDAPFAVSASSPSTGAITYAVVSGPATVSGTIITLTGEGTVVLKASQVAAGNYTAGSGTATFIVATPVTLNLLSNSLVYPLTPVFDVHIGLNNRVAPTGTATVYDGAAAVGTYPVLAILNGNALGLILPSLNVGAHALTAVYSGDSNFTPGTSAPVTVTVTPGTVILGLGCNSTTLKSGQSTTCTVFAAEGLLPATGTVSYTLAGGNSGTGALSNGAVSFTITAPSGVTSSTGINEPLSVLYAAQGNFQAASATGSIRVTK